MLMIGCRVRARPCGHSRFQSASLKDNSRLGCNASRRTCQDELLALLGHGVDEAGIRWGTSPLFCFLLFEARNFATFGTLPVREEMGPAEPVPGIRWPSKRSNMCAGYEAERSPT